MQSKGPTYLGPYLKLLYYPSLLCIGPLAEAKGRLTHSEILYIVALKSPRDFTRVSEVQALIFPRLSTFSRSRMLEAIYPNDSQVPDMEQETSGATSQMMNTSHFIVFAKC